MPGLFVPPKTYNELRHSGDEGEVEFWEKLNKQIFVYTQSIMWDPNCQARGFEKTMEDAIDAWNDGQIAFRMVDDEMQVLLYDDIEDQYEVHNPAREIGDEKDLVDLTPEGEVIQYAELDMETDHEYIFLNYHPN